jgi:hypothetical protein
MKTKYLIQYLHPFHHKWITDATCEDLLEAHDTVQKKKEEVKEITKENHTSLSWRIQPLD